ncbi:hypothetical protein BH23CHL8_BH23CHL8_29470 [soil metagenome]
MAVPGTVRSRFQARWRSGGASGAAYLELVSAATDESELVLYLERPGQPWLRPLWPRQRLEALADRLTRWANASWRASAR